VQSDFAFKPTSTSHIAPDKRAEHPRLGSVPGLQTRSNFIRVQPILEGSSSLI